MAVATRTLKDSAVATEGQGGKVTILTKGFVVTDQINGTPSAGDPAYLNNSGLIGGSQDGDSTLLGRFLSTKDADGYAKVAVNLP